MNEHTVKGAWQDIKGEIQQLWGKLTGDELDRTEGNMTSVAGMIREKYGHTQDEVSSKLDSIVNKYNQPSNQEGVRTPGQKIADVTENIKDGMKNRM